MAVRTAALPGVLGLRWAGRAFAAAHESMPAPERSARVALKVALDEFFFATEAASGSLTISPGEWRRVGREIDVAHDLFGRRGWLADPVAFHRTPPPLLQAREHDVYFSAAHAAKDSHIATALAHEAGLKLPLAEATAAQYDRMIARGIGELDKSGIAELTFASRGGS